MTGCKKSSSTPSPYYMKATIGTYHFDAEGDSKAYLTSSSSGGINLVYINGETTDGKILKLTLVSSSGTISAGTTVAVGAGDAQGYYYPMGIGSSFTYGISGTITISAVSPNYQGTFSFLCADSTVVANGSFLVKAP